MNHKYTDIQTRLEDTRDRAAVRVFLGKVSVVADRPRSSHFPEEEHERDNFFTSLLKELLIRAREFTYRMFAKLVTGDAKASVRILSFGTLTVVA